MFYALPLKKVVVLYVLHLFYLYIFFQILSSLLLWLLARMVLELAVVLCPMEVVDFFQGVPNEIWFQVVRII